MTRLARSLQESQAAQTAEIAIVFLVACAVIFVGWRVVGPDVLTRQAVVWVANVLMLLTVWIGLRVRGQSWEHFGLTFRFGGARVLGHTVWQSAIVFVVAVVAFVAGSFVMSNVAPSPQSADMSAYNYLEGDLPMLLLALAAVYVVSSFGEEVLYRGFLLHRIAEIGKGGKAAWSIAVVTSAIIFGLAHFGWGIVGVVQTTFMGLALGIAYLITKKNLWVLIMAHAYMDTLLLVQMYIGGAGGGSG